MLSLTPNARTVLESRYLIKSLKTNALETPDQLFERVARALASREKRDRKKWEKKFFFLMSELRFLPNSPTLMNAGTSRGQLSACFVLPVEDHLGKIFDTLKSAALIHQSGGGTGFSFSRLRPRGSEVSTTHGVAAGPVSFIRIFDAATEAIKQGGKRRGANMAVLNVEHPDIVEFIDSKRDLKSMTNFNISVGISDSFMARVREGTENSRQIFKRLVHAAWECGDPGLVFLDRVNRFNPTPLAGAMESTNPCGEQPLLPFESCNLGSLSLPRYLAHSGPEVLDWNKLQEDIHTAVRFLDNVIDINFYPVSACKIITKKNRKIGLGVMGFADLLLLKKIPYDSESALELGEKIMAFVDHEAKAASRELAKKRGAFKTWKGSLWEKLGYAKMRNATVSTVAPTGTISMIAGVSSGIEPIFSGAFVRNVLSGQKLKEVHPAVMEAFRERGMSVGEIDDEKIASALGASWRPAQRISVESHVKMQAAFQRHCDSAVSKTINLPERATPDDVEHAYHLAFNLGCKGITVYRDRSRPTQVLDVCTDC